MERRYIAASYIAGQKSRNGVDELMYVPAAAAGYRNGSLNTLVDS
jgi:hypothetical protein